MTVRVALIGEHQLTLLGLAWRVRSAPQMEMAGMLARSDGAVERAKRARAQAAVLDIPRADEIGSAEPVPGVDGRRRGGGGVLRV